MPFSLKVRDVCCAAASTRGTASNSVIEKTFAAGPDGAAALLITTVFLAPLLEETVFRGFLLPSLTRWVPVPWALGISTTAGGGDDAVFRKRLTPQLSKGVRFFISLK